MVIRLAGGAAVFGNAVAGDGYPAGEGASGLRQLVREDLATAAFPFLSFKRVDIGMIPAFVGRVSFTGDLGYEIWVTTDYQRALYDLLVAAGRDVKPAEAWVLEEILGREDHAVA